MCADAQGVQGISDIITIPGLVNVDFADVKAIMCNSGTAMLGVGVSTGKNRAEEAAMARPPHLPPAAPGSRLLAVLVPQSCIWPGLMLELALLCQWGA